MGLAGEAGELVDNLKKHLYQGHELDLKEVSEEIGDILWYTGNIANIFNINLSTVMDQNIEKLKKRYPAGFDKNRSINR